MVSKDKSAEEKKQGFYIMAGAYALTFRELKGRLPDQTDAPLTASQEMPHWTHIFYRLENDGITLTRAIALTERNLDKWVDASPKKTEADKTDSRSSPYVLAINIALIRKPGLSGEALRHEVDTIRKNTMAVAAEITPTTKFEMLKDHLERMQVNYLGLLLQQLNGKGLEYTDKRGSLRTRDFASSAQAEPAKQETQSLEMLAGILILRRHGIDYESLLEQAGQLANQYRTAAAEKTNVKDLSAERIEEAARKLVLADLQKTPGPGRKRDPEPS